MEEKDFRKIVLILSMVQNLIDVADHPECKTFIKGQSKRRMRLLVESLEKDTKEYINKLYDTDDVLYQALQEASVKHLHYLLNNTIESIVNENHK